MARREQMAVEAHQRAIPDGGQPADDARGGQPGHEHQDDGEARQRLCRENPSR
jgi:hypothetical protein